MNIKSALYKSIHKKKKQTNTKKNERRKKKNASKLTYAGIMFLNIKQVPATSALITAPCILAATFRALTSFLLLTFINICVWKKNREGGERERLY